MEHTTHHEHDCGVIAARAYPLLLIGLSGQGGQFDEALLPVIVAQTVSQLAAGITFTGAEVAGPIGGFLVLGVAALLIMARLLRVVADG
jgi:hypothetical protein